MGRPSVDVNDQSCNVIPSESSVADLEAFVQLIRGSTICKRAQVSIIIWKHVLRIFQNVPFEFRMLLPCTLHGCTIHKKPGASFSTFLEHWLNGLTWKREQGRVQKASVERQNKKITRMSFMHLYLLLYQWVMIIGVLWLCVLTFFKRHVTAARLLALIKINGLDCVFELNDSTENQTCE